MNYCSLKCVLSTAVCLEGFCMRPPYTDFYFWSIMICQLCEIIWLALLFLRWSILERLYWLLRKINIHSIFVRRHSEDSVRSVWSAIQFNSNVLLIISIVKPCWDWLHFALLRPLCDCAKLLGDGLYPFSWSLFLHIPLLWDGYLLILGFKRKPPFLVKCVDCAWITCKQAQL